ncbi:MAG: chemotaxis protein CheV [Gammaproteobacteria bacterium]|nr:chemotaxis protein CheV [Gammaproteobacteria bacterium]MDP2139347.1 chemotaxis protein CheV [Gammaproteobacteria bacterium]MDP2347262.1 chemotaxis protein CheV [Gammaproteobacteria bacterium]
MAGLMESVNQRTQLVGQNRLELLLFKLASNQVYGINVFKVKEVLQCPRLTVLPRSSSVVRGVAYIRGRTISVLDLSIATGHRPIANVHDGFIIITEYNDVTQGFLVSSVERIVNMNWEAIHPPPKGSGKDNYLTAVTEVDNRLVEILDVERILAEVSPPPRDLSADVIRDGFTTKEEKHHVLIVDDSSVARNQIRRCCEALGLETTLLNDGRQALAHLQEMLEQGQDPTQFYSLIISDIEMPEMDGYTLTANIKGHPRLSRIHVLLHTSLSGVFNKAMVEKVGADDFLAKFNPDELGRRVIAQIGLRVPVAV